MLLYFVQNVFFRSKIILFCVIIAIQHTSSSETSARKTQLAKQDRGRKRPLRKTRCGKFPVKLVLSADSENNAQDDAQHLKFKNNMRRSRVSALAHLFQ